MSNGIKSLVIKAGFDNSLVLNWKKFFYVNWKKTNKRRTEGREKDTKWRES